ncbi:hypothetical protein J437_LFUL003736 [Ladona fulva]|uniref:RING-type domain-containing protein n=1 Tax=Ladona fulva TaxID=123851 RepID=A0A8K0JWZ3_LADFU|nr:hypothetical protein J437_LFUL003736 [Ladona fulva]
MEGSSVDFSKVINEIELVIGLLKEKGVKEDVDANLIFEKLERKTEEKSRVAEVVDEIISEKTAKDVDVIVIDDDQESTDVEILVDLKDNYTSPYNQYGNVADRARKIFERERGVKRSGCPIDQCQEEGKRLRESEVFDLFDDSFPIEEVQAIEEAVAASTRDSLETGVVKESVTTGAQNKGSFHEEFSSFQGGYFELAAEKKVENTLVQPACTNLTRSDQGSVEFLFNNIDPGSESFVEVDGGEHDWASTPDPSCEMQRKGEKAVSNELASRYSKISKNETEMLSSSTEGKVLSSLLPKKRIEVKVPHTDESLNSSEVDHTPIVLAHRKLKALFNQKEPSVLDGVSNHSAGNNFVRIINEVGSNHPVPSCSKTKYEDNQPSCSFNSFQNTSRRFEERDWADQQPVASTSGAFAQKELQVDLVESSLKTEDACKVARIAPLVQLEDFGMSISNEEANANLADKSALYEEQLQYLIAVLPDADPAFLEGLVRDCEGNDERLKDFVANALDNNGGKPIYPTRGESQQRKEEEDLIKRFTDNFSVEDYLQVFPDPVGHFESETREIEDYLEHSMAYLRCKFRHLYICNIMTALKKRKYNLTLTALDLSKFNGTKRKSKRGAGDCKWPRKQSIAFLQEVAYLENKEKILAYIEEKKAKRQKAFEEIFTAQKCKEQSHIPLRCEEVEKNSQVKARTYIEDKMTEALVRTCWKCSKKFIKESGCNKMTCTCGAIMCYLCRQPVKDYKHFNPESHRQSDLCPLYSNDGQLDFNAVKAMAKKAKEEVLQQNPDIELIHDPTQKLPEVPQNPPRPQGVLPAVPEWELMDLIPLNVREMLVQRQHHPQRRVVPVYPFRPAVAQIEVVPLDGNPGGYLDGMMPVYIDNYQRREDGNAHVAYPPPPPRNHVPYRRH